MYETYFCPRCQTQIQRNTAVCPKCGARFSGNVDRVERCRRCGRLTPINSLNNGYCPACASRPGAKAVSPYRVVSNIVMWLCVFIMTAGVFTGFLQRFNDLPQVWRYLLSALVGLLAGGVVYLLFRVYILGFILGLVGMAAGVGFTVAAVILWVADLAGVADLAAQIPLGLSLVNPWTNLALAAISFGGGFCLLKDTLQRIKK